MKEGKGVCKRVKECGGGWGMWRRAISLVCFVQVFDLAAHHGVAAAAFVRIERALS